MKINSNVVALALVAVAIAMIIKDVPNFGWVLLLAVICAE